MNKPIEKKEIDLLDIWRIALKRKWIIIFVAASILTLAAVYSFTRVPMYRATAQILIEDPGSNMLDLETQFGAQNFRYDYMGAFFNTQLQLLTSRSMAERVARKMNLSERPELKMRIGPRFDIFASMRKFLSFRWLIPSRRPPRVESGEGAFSDEPLFTLDVDPDTAFAGWVNGGLSVSPIVDTRLVNVSYSSPYPGLATDIVNTVVREFIDYSIEMRYEATQQASEFLTDQIATLRAELSSQEREIQKYGEEKNLLYLDDNESAVVSKFSKLNDEYTQAQITRVNAQETYRELNSLVVDSLPQYINNPVIQNLKSEYSRKLNEYEQKLKQYRPEYPEMQSLTASINGLRSQIRLEIDKAKEAAQSDFRAAQRKEESLGRLLEGQRQDVVSMNNNAILYNSLKIEVENKRNLLNSLVARQNETLVSARLKGLKSSNIKIIDTALTPGSPYSPDTQRNLMVGLLFGLMCGIGLAFFIDYLDNTIKGPDDVERLVELPSLGIIPLVSADGAKRGTYNSAYRYTYGSTDKDKEGAPQITEVELVNHKYPNLSISEDYRTVRTSILYARAEGDLKVIGFSSAFPQEGKTATIVNTAVSFAQLDKNVLLIDGDMRKPRQHKIFKLRNVKGLSSYLTGKVGLEDAVQLTSVDRLHVIPSGPHPPNPAELLESRKMRELIEEVRHKYDMVLVDAPPALAVIDPVIIASSVDAMVIVIRAGKTTRKALVNTVQALYKGNSDILGIIYNEMRIQGRGLYSPNYHGYLDGYYEAKT